MWLVLVRSCHEKSWQSWIHSIWSIWSERFGFLYLNLIWIFGLDSLFCFGPMSYSVPGTNKTSSKGKILPLLLHRSSQRVALTIMGKGNAARSSGKGKGGRAAPKVSNKVQQDWNHGTGMAGIRNWMVFLYITLLYYTLLYYTLLYYNTYTILYHTLLYYTIPTTSHKSQVVIILVRVLVIVLVLVFLGLWMLIC